MLLNRAIILCSLGLLSACTFISEPDVGASGPWSIPEFEPGMQRENCETLDCESGGVFGDGTLAGQSPHGLDAGVMNRDAMPSDQTDAENSDADVAGDEENDTLEEELDEDEDEDEDESEGIHETGESACGLDSD